MMSSFVHCMSLGHLSGETVNISPTVKGATEVLKFLPEDFLRRSAFVWGVDAITPSVCRVGILEVFWSRHLIVFQECLLPVFSC